MLEWIKRIHADSNGNPSWYRVASSVALLPILFAIVWSVINQYGDGVFWSSTLFISVMGLKTVQKKME